MTKIYIKQRQPNQWTLVFEDLKNTNFFINGHVQWVCGHHGCGIFVQMKHHYVPILFNLTLQYQNFSSVFNISQGCDHVVKGLNLNCEVHNYCFYEGVSLLALFILMLVLMFSSYKLQLWSFMCCLPILKVQKVFFALVCIFSSHSCPPLFVGFHVLKFNYPPFCVGLLGFKLLPSSFWCWSSCFQVSTNFLSCWSSCY